MERPDWDEWAMGIALAVSKRADCRRKQVGAVILDSSHRVIATGYNGAASGRPGCLKGACPRGLAGYDQIPEGADYDTPGPGFCIATHAEMNALLDVDKQRLAESAMYVTIEPCHWCSKVIANTGVYKIVFPEGDLLKVRLV